MKKLVCSKCGSDDINVDAFVRWDVKSQQFVLSCLSSEYLDYTYADCASCGEAHEGVAVWEELS